MPNTLEFKAGEDYYFISTSTKLDIHRYTKSTHFLTLTHEALFGVLLHAASAPPKLAIFNLGYKPPL